MIQEKTYQQLFVGGDLSGIQKFLYNISSRKAAVSLKGRSDYLSQYMQDVSAELEKAAEQAGATSTKGIYNSGGKFYFLTTNDDRVRQAIDKRVAQRQEELWKEHLGQLGLSVCYVPFTENDDGTVDAAGQSHVGIGVLWREVSRMFAKEKKQKFKKQLSEHFADFFEPVRVGGTPRICAVTGIESDACVRVPNEDFYVLPSVYQQIERGRELNRGQCVEEFGDYADGSFLGILRMDVDGLGTRLNKGFKTFDEYMGFSKRLCDMFERDVVNWQADIQFKGRLTVVYSGGDDVFVVGRWDKVIDFAEKIQTETRQRFEVEQITISGGVVVVNPKFPISKAADMAGDAEDAAKHFNEGAKNAFCLFGKVVSWNGEFDKVKRLKDRMVGLIKNSGMSRSILHRIMLYASIAEKNKRLEQLGNQKDFRYVWHFVYFLTRYMEANKNNDEVIRFCETLRNGRFLEGYGRELELIALAARWAELILKENIND
ncbi:MAG: hypothetical protein K6D59_01595 [Bacteroidales bacterium]|nr:hypothetical protein [Bacteroidales bacterium]